MKILNVFVTVLAFVAFIGFQNSSAQAIHEYKERPFDAYYFDQAENGVYTRQAILSSLLGEV